VQFFYQGIRRLCWHKSENWGEDANRTQKVAVFQSREGTEGEGEPARKKKLQVNTNHETWFAGYKFQILGVDRFFIQKKARKVFRLIQF
jgi:hypothetical protein